MQLCEYCRKEAKYQFKNGKWCCKPHHSKCPKIIEKNTVANIGEKSYWYGKTLPIETIKKMSLKKKGKSNPSKGRIASKEEREKNSKSHIGKSLTQETIRKLKYNIKSLKENHLLFCKIEEIREHPETKELQVRCKNHNCKNSKEKDGWFTPNSPQIGERIRQIKRGYDGSYLYCCDECKKSCRLYNKRATQLIKEDQINTGIKEELIYTPEEYNIWRKEVLKRAEYKCEYCGEPAEHCHHLRPQKLEPFFSLDPDFGIACCSKCHYEKGHKTGTECSTGQIGNKICIK